MKLVINRRFGGFGVSDDGFRWLIDRGVPVVPHYAQQRDPETGYYLPEPRNEGNVIVDYLHPNATWGDGRLSKDSFVKLCGRFSASWIEKDRSNPLLVELVEALGDRASGRLAGLKVIEIPDGVEFEIDNYDGMETVHEKHRSWP